MDDDFHDEESQFLADVDADDTAFYDGPTGEEGKPYWQPVLPAWARELKAEPAPAPVWDKPLLTPEEFIAKYGWKGQGRPKPEDA